MPLNRQQRAAQDLTEKLNLEQELMPQVRDLFNRISDEFNRSMLESGVPPAMENWQSFFEEMLLSHYQATSDVFSRRMRDQLDLTITEDEEQQINTALAIFFANEASSSAERITQTNNEQATQAVQRTRSQEIADVENGEAPYNEATRAAVSTNIFRNLVLARVVTIATTETQAAAEASKLVESDVVNYRRPTINNAVVSSLEVNGDKTWTAILDSVTRATHVDADNQTVAASSFFIIGGYRMQFPGDRRAPIEEWINCRCCAIYTPSGDSLLRRSAA